jgi:nucleotide-binding universal stress UspA family protein
VLGPRRPRSRFTVAPSTAQRLLARRTHVVAIAPINFRRGRDLKALGCVLDESRSARGVHEWAAAFAERSEVDLQLLAAPRKRRGFAGWADTLERAGDLDLLIIGSRGLRPVLAGFRSDLAAALARASRCPTIVIPIDSIARTEIRHASVNQSHELPSSPAEGGLAWALVVR